MGLEEIRERLNAASAVYIYGAGVIAYGAYKALQGLFGAVARCFLVTDAGGQPGQLDGVPVLGFGDARVERGGLVVVATPEEYHGSIVGALRGRGILGYMLLDSGTEYQLMGAYLKKEAGLRLIEEYQAGSSAGDAGQTTVYMAASLGDKGLRGEYPDPPWVKRIQVGAALTGERIAALTDGACPEMSGQNALYGELTASYYAWKHDRHEVTGIFHYRRVLDISGGQAALLERGEVDAVLPLPFVCYPDASGQYGRYLLPEDVGVMLQVLEEMEPGDFGAYKALLRGPYLYNYNILVARREVFDDYCGWLFPRLAEIARRCEAVKRERMPRYIGRAGEVLTSLYFMGNKRKWKIAHAQKVWRV